MVLCNSTWSTEIPMDRMVIVCSKGAQAHVFNSSNIVFTYVCIVQVNIHSILCLT